MPGTLFIVATPIGNLEDISARALRILAEVSVVAAEDTRRTGQLLTRYAIATPTTSLHEHNEIRKAPVLLARLSAGENIALVSDAGTPLISDPGEHLIKAAIAAGIRVEPIPGPSAIVAALAASGFQTHPFIFLGFPPTRSKDRKSWLSMLSSQASTAIFFEAPHRIRRTLRDISAIIGDVTIVIGRELTKIHEELVRGPISEVLLNPRLEIGELTVVIDLRGRALDTKKDAVSDGSLANELGQLTESEGLTRRKAIQLLAEKYHRRPNEVYAAVERARRAVK
jgi:16S rRNA (cytidine1402-2'-O)-methyltransferase